jgi:hypothetical protein
VVPITSGITAEYVTAHVATVVVVTAGIAVHTVEMAMASSLKVYVWAATAAAETLM